MPEAAQDTKQEADDVAASVAAAFDKLEAASDEPPADTPTEPPAEPEAAAAAEEPPKPEDTDIVPRETSADEPDEQASSDQPAEQPPAPAETIEYPQNWDQSQKTEFEALPDNSKHFLLNRHKQMEADYTQKTMEIADFKREYEPIDQMMRAFAPIMQAQNIGPGGLIRRWAQAESYLNSQPEQAIKTLANHYGVDLAAIAYDQPAQQQGAEHGNQAQPDPQVQLLASQVNNLTTQQNLQQINAFADEIGQDGQKLHPYFDDVAQVIVQDMKAARMLGLQPSLQDLYDQACWKTPAVRDKLMAAQTGQVQAQTQQAAQQAADAARQKAQQARKAGSSISGDAGSSAEPAPVYSSIEEATAAAYDKHTH